MDFNKKKEADFYKAKTNGIEVRVKPEYVIGHSSSNIEKEDVFIWAYHVRIENKSDKTFQIISRYWKIIDEKGGVQEVNGDGVIGEQPILTPGSNFHYSSSVNLSYPSGIMLGHYVMRKEDDQAIEIKIPTFSLDIPNIQSVVN